MADATGGPPQSAKETPRTLVLLATLAPTGISFPIIRPPGPIVPKVPLVSLAPRASPLAPAHS
jgi:hypothetical protein